MATKIIVSYDGTENDLDALALGRLLGGAGASLALAYVRHAQEAESGRERLAEHEAQALLEKGGGVLGQPDVPRHVVLSGSTPEGLRELALAEHADLIVFGSEYRTAAGHVDPQSSARRLLDGGPGRTRPRAGGLRRADGLPRPDDRGDRRGRRPVCARDRGGARLPVRRDDRRAGEPATSTSSSSAPSRAPSPGG